MSAGVSASTWVLGGAMLGSALLGSNASGNAANAQMQAANQANDTQLQMFNTAQQNLQPYMAAGTPALSKLSDLLGTSGNTGAAGYGSLTAPFTNQTFQNYVSPAYNFQLQQGDQALQNSQAATDGVLSGSALKGLINYNQNMATTAYQNAFNNYQTQTGNIYQRLSGLVGIGQASASGNAANAMTTGANVGANTVQAGNAAAAGIMGSNNAITGAINNGAGYYMLNQMMNNGGMNFNG